MTRVLVVEDDRELAREIQEELADRIEGLELRGEATVAGAERALDAWRPQLLLVDLGLPRTEGGAVEPLGGSALIARAEAQVPPPLVVVLSGAERETAVRLLLDHGGVADYLFKDSPWDETAARLTRHVEDLRRREALASAQGATIIGSSPTSRQLREEIALVAPQETPVLITGESGTGKELVAREVHARSRRVHGPFVALNCAALTESLVESELFGHVRGAFTGAEQDRAGRFEQARGGTLFLDEIGDLPAGTQAKLLRVLEDQTYHRVGSDTERTADVRLLAATNRDLEQAIAAGEFRQDLYYRLAVFPLSTTPLRARPEEIPELVAHFLERLGGSAVDPEAQRLLQAHDWPGNVRELRNVVERLIILARGRPVAAALVQRVLATDGPGTYRVVIPPDAVDYQTAKEQALAAFSREFLTRALARHNGNIQQTSKEIGYNRRTLSETLRQLGIDPARFKDG
jgi:DNA-binding NtrC family response regulator